MENIEAVNKVKENSLILAFKTIAEYSDNRGIDPIQSIEFEKASQLDQRLLDFQEFLDSLSTGELESLIIHIVDEVTNELP